MESRKLMFERVSSIDRLLKLNQERERNKAFKNSSKEASTNASKDFTETESYEQAEQLIENGWEEPLSKLKKGRLSAKTNVKADKRRPSTGVIGYAPCVPNAIIGLPNSMITTDIVRQKVKAVTIVYSISVKAGVSADEMIKAGITVLNIVNSLELEGIRVNLIVEAMNTTTSKSIATLWLNVKDWRETIDIKKLAFPMVHPSMLRRIAFRWLETYEAIDDRSFPDGYGVPLGNKEYEDVVSTMKDIGLLKDNEYYINAQLCLKCNNDMHKVMERAGMSDLKLKK